MKALFIFLFLMVTVQVTVSQANFSTVKSGRWNDHTVWNTQSVPSLTDNVSVLAGNSVTVDSTAFCANLDIASGAVLVADSGRILNISGNWSNSGTYTAGSSKVLFNGTGLQTISGATSFYEVEMDGTAGVKLLTPVKIKYLLKLSQGIFNTNGFKLTLLSDSALTAAIAPIAAGADITGNVSVQRYISSTTTGWRFLGSPVRTTLQDWADDFTTSGFPGSGYPGFYFCSVYSYNETYPGTSDNGYVIPTGITDSILPGVGYWCWIGPAPSTVEVSGAPGKFNHSFNISFTPSAGKNEDGWNMIANPYPSAINWDATGWSKTGLQDAIYVWDPQTEQYATYINGSSINGGSNIIPSSRAFWVQAGQADAALSCNESVKVTGSGSFLRNANAPSIKLTLSGNSYKDETIILLSGNASANVRLNEDAKKLYSDNTLVPSITSIADSLNLAVNSIPDNSEATVPVKVKVGVSGVYTISMNQGYSLNMSSCIFLEDLLTGSYINLRSAVSYTFFIADTTSSPRFLLHISKPLIKSAIGITCSYKQNGMAIAKVNVADNWTYTWKDALGNVLTERKTMQADTLKNLSPGTYHVEAKSKNGYCTLIEEEIVVIGATALAVATSVKDNECSMQHAGEIGITLVSGGSVPYYYNWSNGKNTMVVQNLQSGVYTLILTDANGCKDTSYHAVKTRSMLKAAFEIDNDTTNLFVNDVIVFNNQSLGVYATSWKFDDTPSMAVNPVHVFKTPGTHTIVLTASDKSCSSSVQKMINVKDAQKPIVSVEQPAKNISIYNSGDDAIVRFNLQEPSPSVVSVYTADGKIISVQHLSAYQNTESFRLGESHGMYVVHVESGSNDIIEKLIK